MVKLDNMIKKFLFFTGVLGELVRGKLLLVKFPRGEFPRGIFPRGKLPHEKLPRIYQYIFHTSFIKNEVRTCHRIKFSFVCSLKSFLLHTVLCESVQILNLLGTL